MKRSLALSALVCTSVLLAACGGTTPSGEQNNSSSSSQAQQAALIAAQGGLGDGAYNDLANSGFQKATKAAGIRGSVIESKDVVAEGEQLVRRAATSGFGLIVDLEFSHADMLTKTAKDYPNVDFALFNAPVSGSNAVSVLFEEQQGSYLAGVLAAKMTQVTGNDKINSENRIGVVGGTKSTGIDKFISGYIQGAQSVDPAIVVDVKYADSFSDAGKVKQITQQMYANGSDIVFAVAGGAGNGAIEAAKDSNHYVIGVDSDQDSLAKGYVLTSMIKRSDVAAETLVSDYAAGKFPGGQTLNFGLKENGVGLSDMQYTKQDVPQDALTAVEKARKDIVDGTLTVWDVTAQGYPSWLK